MAAHSLSIAKATLLASCLRPDSTKLSRDELTTFHRLLETCICTCTPTNIQNAKSWLRQHILPSSLRTIAFSKYLATLSKNITALPENSQIRPCRRRLHLLYLVNDIFHHVNRHSRDEPSRSHTRDHISDVLPELFACAAAEHKSRTESRLHDLVQIWEHEKYLDQVMLKRLREALSSGTTADSKTPFLPEVKTSKELPWIMPPSHGDPAAPFFDLPAANLMPHIVPNSSKPMRPERIHALPLTAGPADDSLVQAMKDFLKDVKSIDDPYAALEDEGIVPDIDEMGQISYKNEAGDLAGYTYYGWSRTFCENMKTSHGKDDSRRGRSRSPSTGSSRSARRSPRKRRRYTSSRSHSRSQSGGGSPKRYHSRDRRPPTQSKTETQAYSAELSSFQGRPQHHQPPLSPAVPTPLQPTHSPHPMFQPQQPQSAPISPFQPPTLYNGMPVPPRPQNWSGPWPPPPPPPPGAFQGPFPNMPFPPPPPPQNWNNQGCGRR